jgi:futalosine hydrolase
MNCLVIASTGTEIKPLLAWLREPAQERRDVDVLVTGVGLMATTYALTRQISLKRPGFVIQAGIAGSLKKSTAPGSVVVIQKDMIADQGVKEKDGFKSVFDLGLANDSCYPFTKGWLVNPGDILQRTNLAKARGITVNKITTAPRQIAEYKERYDPVVESMEGAALHFVCLKENIPFLQLRAISNHIGERNKKNWKMKESIANLNKELVQLLETL